MTNGVYSESRDLLFLNPSAIVRMGEAAHFKFDKRKFDKRFDGGQCQPATDELPPKPWRQGHI